MTKPMSCLSVGDRQVPLTPSSLVQAEVEKD